MRVAAERGPEAVSLRHVATAAGVSTGMVQHYFGTKDEMMNFALRAMNENVGARMESELDDPSSPAEVLRTLLVQLLPLDDTRRLEGRFGLAAVTYAVSHPAVAEVLRAGNAELRAFIAESLRAMRDNGAVSQSLDPGHTAIALAAMVDGLGLQVLSGSYPASDALAAFDAQLATILGLRDRVERLDVVEQRRAKGVHVGERVQLGDLLTGEPLEGVVGSGDRNRGVGQRQVLEVDMDVRIADVVVALGNRVLHDPHRKRHRR
ncbi:MAG: TetR/AcrR family transcriptional regulator [Stackebrandtia sp.]